MITYIFKIGIGKLGELVNFMR